MSEGKLYMIGEVTKLVPVEETFVVHCVESEWIHPADPGRPALDEADVARLRLILELKDMFGANDESIPLILHLMDQLHTLHARAQDRKSPKTVEVLH